MPRYKGFKAWIEYNEVRLQEYDSKCSGTPGKPVIDCYIASTAGQSFAVHWCCEAQIEEYCAAEIYVDGLYVAYDDVHRRDSDKHRSVWGHQIIKEHRARFTFAKSTINVQEEDEEGRYSGPTSPFGRITVKFTLGRPLRRKRRPFDEIVSSSAQRLDRANKAGAEHYAEFADPQVCILDPIWPERLDYALKPSFEMEFNFRYRPMERLRNEIEDWRRSNHTITHNVQTQLESVKEQLRTLQATIQNKVCQLETKIFRLERRQEEANRVRLEDESEGEEEQMSEGELVDEHEAQQMTDDELVDEKEDAEEEEHAEGSPEPATEVAVRLNDDASRASGLRSPGFEQLERDRAVKAFKKEESKERCRSMKRAKSEADDDGERRLAKRMKKEEIEEKKCKIEPMY